MKTSCILLFLINIFLNTFLADCQNFELLGLTNQNLNSHKISDFKNIDEIPYLQFDLTNDFQNKTYGFDIIVFNYKIANILHYPINRILNIRNDEIALKNAHFNLKTDFENNFSYFFSTEYYFFCYTYEKIDYSTINFNIERQSFSLINYFTQSRDYCLKASFSIVENLTQNSKFYCYSVYVSNIFKLLPIRKFPKLKFASCIYYYNKKFDFMLGIETKIWKNILIGATYDDFMNKKILNLYLKFLYFSKKPIPKIYL